MMRSDAVFAVSFKLNWLNLYLFNLIKFIYRFFKRNVKLCENRHAFYPHTQEKEANKDCGAVKMLNRKYNIFVFNAEKVQFDTDRESGKNVQKIRI